jgi:hypothetical protein
MKRFGVISLLVLAGLCTAGVAKAQDREVRANVPFDFVVASKHLPAGSYEFLTQSNRTTILIRNGSQQIFVLATADDAGRITNYSSRLVFYKYGDRYFLREIHCPTIAVNADFPRSKEEKQLNEHLAWLGPDTVLLALNGN